MLVSHSLNYLFALIVSLCVCMCMCVRVNVHVLIPIYWLLLPNCLKLAILTQIWVLYMHVFSFFFITYLYFIMYRFSLPFSTPNPAFNCKLKEHAHGKSVKGTRQGKATTPEESCAKNEPSRVTRICNILHTSQRLYQPLTGGRTQARAFEVLDVVTSFPIPTCHLLAKGGSLYPSTVLRSC